MPERIFQTVEIKGAIRDLVKFVSHTTKPLYLTKSGKPLAVMLDIDSYNALLDALEGQEYASTSVEDSINIMKKLLNQAKQFRTSGQSL